MANCDHKDNKHHPDCPWMQTVKKVGMACAFGSPDPETTGEIVGEVRQLVDLNSTMQGELDRLRQEFTAVVNQLQMTTDPFAWRGVWHVRHADGAEEDIALEHGNLVEDSRGSVGQFLLAYDEEMAAKNAALNERLGELKKLNNPGHSVWINDPGHAGWRTEREAGLGKDSDSPKYCQVQINNEAHVIGQNMQCPLCAPGRWPTCSECGYTGYMVTKIMGHQATAYMCPAQGCGHLTPIPNAPVGASVSQPPAPPYDFAIREDGEVEALSERAKQIVSGVNGPNAQRIREQQAEKCDTCGFDKRVCQGDHRVTLEGDRIGEEPCG